MNGAESPVRTLVACGVDCFAPRRKHCCVASGAQTLLGARNAISNPVITAAATAL